ncbi:glutathione S-transferase N-terminal domain-containing protein [Roseovarius confluentis]|uniref:glutathione S-transferase N-terminal domain-containing protein n=1 Tax=Roseovarius confluentis TaxID=1852027 RepID=UPI003BAA61B6
MPTVHRGAGCRAGHCPARRWGCQPACSECSRSAQAPLGKIPVLVRPGQAALYDSPVICEYLDAVWQGQPVSGRRRGAMAGPCPAGPGGRGNGDSRRSPL